MRRAAILAALAVAACAWGVLGHAGDGLSGGRWLTALGAPWLLVGFAAGAIAARDRLARGALAGAVALILGVVAYYIDDAILHQSHLYDAAMTVAWSAAAAPVGAIAGAAGASVWKRPAAGLLPAAALIAEA